MAILGNTYITPVGSWNQLRLVWTASQNTGNNTSTVTARFYWETKSGNGRVDSSATKTGSITIDGVTSNFTASANLSAGSSRLLHTYTRTLSHNSSGNKGVSFSATFNMDVRLSGTPYSSRTVSGSDTLKPIPRESTLGSNASFTAGSNKTISINRFSTSFNHQVDISVARADGVYDLIKTLSFSTSQTSQSTSFSIAQSAEVFQHLAGRSSAGTRMVLRTYSGSTLIGTRTYTGTVTSPTASVLNSSFDKDITIGDSIPIGLSRQNSNFTHTIVITLGSFSKTFTNVGASVTWNLTSAETSSMMSQLSSSESSKVGSLTLTTYWSGQKIRATANATLTFRIPSSGNNPTFSASQIAYSDANPTTSTLTGNNQYIIQGRSSLRVQIVSAATPKNGATISRYVITVNGVSKSQTTTGYNTIGAINASQNVTLTVRVYDSRGLSTTISKPVMVIPYTPPSVEAHAIRTGGYGEATVLSLKGTISPIRVGSTNKNIVVSARSRFRISNGSYNTNTSFTLTQNIPAYTATNRTVTLANTSSWQVEFTVSDHLSTTTVVKEVPVGQPLFFFDAAKRSIGINDFPLGEKELRINARVVFGSNVWASSNGGEGDSGGVMDLNNSDIVGLNGLYFEDIANNNGEGLSFLKTGSPQGSGVYSDYDNFRILDGVVMVNGRAIALGEAEVHWTGYSFVHDTVSIPLVRPLAQCPNGLILIWSRYFEGAPVSSDWNITIIPRDYNSYAGSSGMWCPLIATGTSATTPTMCYKYIYPRATTLNGHARNNTGVESGQVLRAIITF